MRAPSAAVPLASTSRYIWTQSGTTPLKGPFVNSYGDPEHLYLSNWYLRFEFGMRRLMRPSVIVSTGVLVVMLCVIVGGAV